MRRFFKMFLAILMMVGLLIFMGVLIFWEIKKDRQQAQDLAAQLDKIQHEFNKLETAATIMDSQLEDLHDAAQRHNKRVEQFLAPQCLTMEPLATPAAKRDLDLRVPVPTGAELTSVEVLQNVLESYTPHDDSFRLHLFYLRESSFRTAVPNTDVFTTHIDREGDAYWSWRELALDQVRSYLGSPENLRAVYNTLEQPMVLRLKKELTPEELQQFIGKLEGYATMMNAPIPAHLRKASANESAMDARVEAFGWNTICGEVMYDYELRPARETLIGATQGTAFASKYVGDDGIRILQFRLRREQENKELPVLLHELLTRFISALSAE